MKFLLFSVGSRPSDKGGHPDPEIRGGGGGGGLQTNVFRHFGPHLGRKIRGEGPGSPGPSPRFVTVVYYGSTLINLSTH